VRVVQWNVRQGGGGVRAGAIAEALLAHGPDVVVLCEYRPTATAPVVSALRDAGLEHVAATEPRVSANGVAVLSRLPFTERRPATLTPLQAERWIEADLREAAGFTLAALYVPPIRSQLGKEAFWHALLDAAEQSLEEEYAIVGDLNTGVHRLDENGASFACEGSFAALGGLGYVDAFRTLHGERREYSHGRPEAGHRIDHAFLSPSLAPRLRGFAYSHRERDDLRLSDHSPLILELAEVV
jgi:exonuclease III